MNIRRRLGLLIVATLAVAPCALAQRWEVGGGLGGSFFTSQDVTNHGSNGNVTLGNGFSGSAWLGNSNSSLFGGDLRYDYERSSLKVLSGGQHASFDAETHSIHYDILLHLTPSESRVRPFVSAGGGVKDFRGTGKETAVQSLSNLALLTKTSELRPLLTVSAGVKVSLTHSLRLRVQIQDGFTPFPTMVIAPAQGAKIGGWLQDFTVLVGLSLAF